MLLRLINSRFIIIIIIIIIIIGLLLHGPRCIYIICVLSSIHLKARVYRLRPKLHLMLHSNHHNIATTSDSDT